MIKVCVICHEPFKTNRRDREICFKEECKRIRKYNYNHLSRPTRIKECPICHEPFETKSSRRQICYKEECRLARKREYDRWRQGIRQKPEPVPELNIDDLELSTCDMCGKEFKPHFLNEHFCYDECRYNSPLYLRFFDVDLRF